MVQARAGSGNVVPLMVRVPEDLRDRIKAAAEANGRSQNSEIVATLEEKYPAPLEPEALHAKLSEIYNEVTRNSAQINILVDQIVPGKSREELEELKRTIDSLFEANEKLLAMVRLASIPTSS